MIANAVHNDIYYYQNQSNFYCKENLTKKLVMCYNVSWR